MRPGSQGSGQPRSLGSEGNALPDVHVLICGTCEYITLHSTGDFTDVIQSRAFKTTRWSWIIQVAVMQSQRPYKGGWRVGVRAGDIRMEVEVRAMPFED